MGRFRYLQRLILVHGHLYYYRHSVMILYNIYRNTIFVIPLFLYTITSTAYSVISCIDDLNLILYSAIFTAVPTVLHALLDRDISDDRTLLAMPMLYSQGPKSSLYNYSTFLCTVCDTIYQVRQPRITQGGREELSLIDCVFCL